MTTVAWDGNILAADQMGDFCGAKTTVKKIFRLKGGRLLGGAGSESVVFNMRQWLEDGGERPASQLDEKESCHLLEIHKDKTVILHTRLGQGIVGDKFFAVGSGAHFAIAAMHLGCDARKAVEIAIQYDVYSGGGVDWLEL